MDAHTGSPRVTVSPSLYLKHTHKHTHTRAEILYAFKSGLSILCVCVFTPLVIPVPMVSVALERRVISSFWGVAHWDPGGVQRRGERKMWKEGELLELFSAEHPRFSPRNSWLHVSGVTVLLSNMYPCPFLWVSAIVHALLFSVCSILSPALITSPGFCSPRVWDYKVMLSASAPLCSLSLLLQNAVINWGSRRVHNA